MILIISLLAQTASVPRRITWTDAAPLHQRLASHGITPRAFAAHVDGLHRANLRRVREGDLDHLIFYALQSTRFTALPPIEPALSAKALVDGLAAAEREVFLRTSQLPLSGVPSPVRARVAALLRALDSSASDARLTYFRALVHSSFPDRARREDEVLREYLRVMRFIYQKEFVAQRSASAVEAVAELYRTRGLSTDTEVEAGYLVYLGLGVVKSLDPARRIRRVLIVGPGLDLAPRTALLEAAPPESYQPWAVMDALLALGLSRAGDLQVVAADINPRVVDHLRAAHDAPPTLTLISGITQTAQVTLTPEYRDYVAQLGSAIGKVESGASMDTADGHLRKIVRVDASVARALSAQALDIVTERLDGPPFDLIIATNILPYFDDVALMLALSNIEGMLASGGVFLHNEARASMRELTDAVGLPVEQARQATIATVRNAPAPLVDTIWIHRKR